MRKLYSGTSTQSPTFRWSTPCQWPALVYSFIADDARERRPDRIDALDELQVIHVDRRLLDADQHLAGGRCGRLGNAGKLEDDFRIAERFD
jgi:hypothetical protein